MADKLLKLHQGGGQPKEACMDCRLRTGCEAPVAWRCGYNSYFCSDMRAALQGKPCPHFQAKIRPLPVVRTGWLYRLWRWIW